MISVGHKKTIFIFILFFFMSFCLLFWNFYSLTCVPLISRENSLQILELNREASASRFVSMLQEKGLINQTKPMLFLVRILGYAPQLKAGVYQIKPGESALQLTKRVVSGDVLNYSFAVIAGTTQQKIAQDLAKAPHLRYSSEDWLSIQGNHPNAEGLILADTYQYKAGTSGKALLGQANHHLMDYLNKSWRTRSLPLPYKNSYELLIAASIIEKETALAQERYLIAGVLVNRLNKNMPLQMDPTIIYGLGSAYQGKLSHENMQVDSPYNSYRRRGLPPTPITMVSKESLDAAAHPQLSNYLYFVAKGDGSHQFSETYLQQRQAIEQYQRKGL